MFFARYWLAMPVLAIAGSLAAKKTVPGGPGHAAHAHAAVRGAAGRHGRDRRRAHLRPGARARARSSSTSRCSPMPAERGPTHERSRTRPACTTSTPPRLLVTREHLPARAGRLVREAAAAAPVAQPGDVRGLRRQHPHHDPLGPGARRAGRGAGRLHPRRSRCWLWFTVLFANFAEAIAEGRSKAQADALRAAKRDVDGEEARAAASATAAVARVAVDRRCARATSSWSKRATSSPPTAR